MVAVAVSFLFKEENSQKLFIIIFKSFNFGQNTKARTEMGAW